MIRLIKTIELISNKIILISIILGIIFGALSAILVRSIVQIYDPHFKLSALLDIGLMTYIVYICLFVAISFCAILLTMCTCKLLKPEAEINLSWVNGTPIVEAKNVFYNKFQYICVTLAPLLVTDLAICMMFLFGLVSAHIFAFIFIINTAATSNSIYILSILIRLPSNIVIRDEGTKVQVFIPEL